MRGKAQCSGTLTQRAPSGGRLGYPVAPLSFGTPCVGRNLRGNAWYGCKDAFGRPSGNIARTFARPSGRASGPSLRRRPGWSHPPSGGYIAETAPVALIRSKQLAAGNGEMRRARLGGTIGARFIPAASANGNGMRLGGICRAFGQGNLKRHRLRAEPRKAPSPSGTLFVLCRTEKQAAHGSLAEKNFLGRDSKQVLHRPSGWGRGLSDGSARAACRTGFACANVSVKAEEAQPPDRKSVV